MRFIGVCMTACLVWAAPAAAQGVAQEIDLGISARASRDPASALRHFQKALAEDSTSYVANWQAALTLIDLGKATPDDVKSPARDSMYALAEVYARRAVAANPSDAEGHFALANAVGRASLTKGKKERVRRAAEIRSEALRAIELNPQHDGAYHILGRWNAEIMRLSGLTKFFARNFLGGGVFNQASWEGAVGNLEKAVALNPERIYHRLDLAEVYVDRGRYADARAQLQRIAELPISDPLDPEYQRQAAALLARIADKKDRT
jgi:tetratricopeptide (TPR) repeat protein